MVVVAVVVVVLGAAVVVVVEVMAGPVGDVTGVTSAGRVVTSGAAVGRGVVAFVVVVVVVAVSVVSWGEDCVVTLGAGVVAEAGSGVGSAGQAKCWWRGRKTASRKLARAALPAGWQWSSVALVTHDV